MEEKGKFAERKRRGRDEYGAAASEMRSLWKRSKGKRSKHTRYDDDDDGASSKSNKRGRRIREVIELPNEDLLEEIMLKLPVKTLIRFQTVSKQWKRMITSKAFREAYMLHVKTKGPKFLTAYKGGIRYKPTIDLNTVRLDWSSNSLVEEENYNISDDDEVEDEDEVGMVSNSLDGLFCLHGSSLNSSRQIKVVNPATRCSYKIPLAEVQRRYCYWGKNNFPPLGFGKDYVTGTYKLVWLHSLFKNTLSCEVFDFGVKQWRNVNPPPLFHHGLEKEKLPTFANGWMYWLHQDKTKLIAFDLHKEVFKVIPNPIIEKYPSSSSMYKEIRIDSTDGHHFVWLSLSTYGDDDRMQHVWKLTNLNTRGALSIVNEIFSFNYYKITSSTGFVPNLFEIQPISKNANKFLLSARNHHHLFLLDQPLNSTSFSPLVPSDFPFSQDQITLVPFFPSLVSPF